MPGFNNQALDPQFYTANQVVILIGSQEVGFGQTSSYNSSLGAEQFYQIGTALPGEIQQLRYSPSVTLGYFKLTKRGLALFGYTAATPLTSVLANYKFNITLQDSTGAAIYTFVGCSAGSFNTSVTANSPINEDVDFLALDIWDGNGQSVLKGDFALNYNNNVPSVVGAVTGASVS
jgi:hypothetical protein